jgi:two-component system LytT family response regulator
MLSRLPAAERPLIVFVTARRQHSVKAFELGALDYLLKPFKPARFQQAVARVRLRLRERAGQARPAEAPAPAYLKRLIVRLSEHQLIVPIAEIDWMESASNYIVLHRGGETHVLRDTLSSLERRLSPEQFLRVGRFAIVNLDRIRKLKPTDAGDHIIVMADGAEVPVTCGIREVQARLE